MAVFNNILAGASGQTSGAAAGYQIDRSVRFNDDDNAYLTRTPSSAGNRKTWTWSGWVKRSGLGFHTDFFSAVQSGGNATMIQFDNNDRLDFENFVGNSDKGRQITNAFFRDTSAWYHIVVAYDSTNSTADDRVKIYVNGSQVTSFNYSTNPSSGQTSIVNSTYPHYLGTDKGFNNHYFDGYLADVHFVDGKALAASDFGEYDSNNVWQPKKFEGNHNASMTNLGGATVSSYVSGPVNSTSFVARLYGTIGSGYQSSTTATGGNTLTLDISSLNVTVKMYA